MRWSIIRLIWLRELRDQLRDRRTLFMIAVLPLILYPVLGYGVLKFALGFKERPSVVGLVPGPRGTSDFPELPADGTTSYPPFIHNGAWNWPVELNPLENTALLLAHAKLKFVFLKRPPQDALDLGEVAVVLQASDDFYAQLAKGESGQDRPVVEMIGRPDKDETRQALPRLETLLNDWKRRLKNVRLDLLHLPSTFDEPFQLKEPPASEGAKTEALLRLMHRIFPFMLVMWSLAGALYPAVDLCAGEKERGTMETLLISPAGREEIVLGKFLTIWVFSGGTAYLNLVSMVMTTWHFGQQVVPGPLPVGPLAWSMVLLLPLSAFFSAISLAVGAYARSSKEGQYYLMPLFLVTMPLIFLTLAPGVELNPFYSLVPVTGVALLMQKLMAAPSLAQVPWLYFIPVLAPIAMYSALALRWAIEQFHREEVLFREAERIDVRLWLRRLLQEKPATPTTGQAFFIFTLLVMLHWLSMGLGAQLSMPGRTAINLLAFVAAPPLLMALILNTSPGDGLSLRLPTWRSMGLAALLALLVLPPVATLANLIFTQMPQVSRLLEESQPLVQVFHWFHEGLESLNRDNILTHILVFAFLPAVCEELAFRGFILSGLKKRFRPRTSVMLAAFLYAVYHMNVFQILPYFFLGVIYGLLTLRSGSVYPAMTFHFLHNSALLGGILWSTTETERQAELARAWQAFVIVCAVIALWLLWRLYRKPYVELEQKLAQKTQEERRDTN